MARYDVELLLIDVKAVMTSYLNTKIAAINSEKNDSLVLGTIDSNAYFLQDIDHNGAIPYDPFIYYGIDEVTEVDNKGGGNTSRLITIPVIIVMEDAGQQASIAPRLFRYWRAIEEVFEDHWADAPNKGAIKYGFKSLTPVSWKLENSDARYKCAGITLLVGMT